jgi:ABC-type amino acid transport substrate-binding protein
MLPCPICRLLPCCRLLPSLSRPSAPQVPSVQQATLRVLVLDDAPPLSYRDQSGQLTGFNVEIVRAVCREIQVRCQFEVTTQGAVVDAVAEGKADIAGVGLQETPEQPGQADFCQAALPLAVAVAWPGVACSPASPGCGWPWSAVPSRKSYARRQGWATLVSQHLRASWARRFSPGKVQAAMVPMISRAQPAEKPAFRQLGLVPTVMRIPELGGDVAFGISPRRPELKEEINAALDRIKRNGTYDRINSRFLPFRVS